MIELALFDRKAFTEKVTGVEGPVLVEFGAPWCGPCNLLEPVLADLAEEYAGKVAVYTIDVDQHPDLAMDYHVLSVPTMILFYRGQEQHRMTGFRPRKVLEKTFFST